ncbi:MAG: hypothetical protein ACO1RX_15050 [Candidatus Sericytochromatia bacterium]
MRPLQWVLSGLACWGVFGCASRAPQPERGPEKQVRVLAQLPQGVQCTHLEHVSLRDGTGCANIGRYRQGQIESLNYNLEQQARRRGANLVVMPAPPQEESREGCPQSGLVVEASLYRCDFALDTR